MTTFPEEFELLAKRLADALGLMSSFGAEKAKYLAALGKAKEIEEKIDYLEAMSVLERLAVMKALREEGGAVLADLLSCLPAYEARPDDFPEAEHYFGEGKDGHGAFAGALEQLDELIPLFERAAKAIAAIREFHSSGKTRADYQKVIDVCDVECDEAVLSLNDPEIDEFFAFLPDVKEEIRSLNALIARCEAFLSYRLAFKVVATHFKWRVEGKELLEAISSAEFPTFGTSELSSYPERIKSALDNDGFTKARVLVGRVDEALAKPLAERRAAVEPLVNELSRMRMDFESYSVPSDSQALTENVLTDEDFLYFFDPENGFRGPFFAYVAERVDAMPLLYSASAVETYFRPLMGRGLTAEEYRAARSYLIEKYDEASADLLPEDTREFISKIEHSEEEIRELDVLSVAVRDALAAAIPAESLSVMRKEIGDLREIRDRVDAFKRGLRFLPPDCVEGLYRDIDAKIDELSREMNGLKAGDASLKRAKGHRAFNNFITIILVLSFMGLLGYCTYLSTVDLIAQYTASDPDSPGVIYGVGIPLGLHLGFFRFLAYTTQSWRQYYLMGIQEWFGQNTIADPTVFSYLCSASWLLLFFWSCYIRRFAKATIPGMTIHSRFPEGLLTYGRKMCVLTLILGILASLVPMAMLGIANVITWWNANFWVALVPGIGVGIYFAVLALIGAGYWWPGAFGSIPITDAPQLLNTYALITFGIIVLAIVFKALSKRRRAL